MTVAINYTIGQIANYTGGKLLTHNSKIPAPEYIALDSRKISFPQATIFFGINTLHHSSNEFVESLYKKGVRNFLLEADQIDLNKLKGANVIAVQNTVQALQMLAIHHRQKHDILPDGNKLPVIGITGSNGKTIVKEWLSQLLENEYSIIKSPGSYNSQIGVPISVLNINPSHTLDIFEAGISTTGEMELLEKIIHPTIGILTNIGQAHDEGFKNKRQKINEKLKLFLHAGHIVYSADDEETSKEVIAFSKRIKKENNHLTLFSWGKKQDNTLQIRLINKKENTTKIDVVFKEKPLSITIPFIDDASVENAINCLCALLILGKSGDEIISAFAALHPISMRLELKQGINHCTIINDSYSNDLHSLSIALDFLAHQKQHQQQTVILSDILQSGKKPDVLYKEVASMLYQKKINKLVGIGPELFFHQKIFSSLSSTHFFLSVKDFIKNISSLHFHDENILVKGARVFAFEQIAIALEQKVHQTVLSINLNAAVHNLKQYRQLLKPGTKIMGMVKAFSYGSGSYEIAAVLEFNKIDYLAVAYADEGVELRKAGITLPIMVMNIEESTFSALVNYNLEPEIFSFSILKSFENFLKANGINNYPAHIKIDTGMHRLGFTEGDIKALATHLSGNTFFKIMSAFTHLAASDDENEDHFTQQQIKQFEDAAVLLEITVGYTFYKHAANTSAISRFASGKMNMVRLGIGLYGIDSNKIMQRKLKNVTTLTTTISQIKKVKAGETVGYGRNARLSRDSLIATVRIGYADGYPRSLGNGNGKMMISGKMVPVVGNVCMDMTMLDITGHVSVREGDAVEVFGEKISLPTLALWAQTIPYELMTGISQRVKRVYFDE
ncbi:MAG: bifunctional UDP-N-acetylmuramoyl-tripeptide:D-alanyl-D-alanine ligase/alanine racemase [Bacteroidota bacterium]|nr:bifunctional UDP-N-acetylmuramoyl-tripeptide:D-alanyl-D-alanine ligase/alanine racemase [Bacteroidota bacterium]